MHSSRFFDTAGDGVLSRANPSTKNCNERKDTTNGDFIDCKLRIIGNTAPFGKLPDVWSQWFPEQWSQ